MSLDFKSLMRESLVNKSWARRSRMQGIALIQLLLMLVALLLLAGVGYLLLVESPLLEQVESAISEYKSQPVSQQGLQQGAQQGAQQGSQQDSKQLPLSLNGTVADSTGVINPDAQPVIAPLQQSAGTDSATPVESSGSPVRAVDQKFDGLPGLNQSDAPFRAALVLLATDSPLVDWLISEELVRKLVVTIDNMADGKIPRKHALLQPMADKFKVSRKGQQLWLDGYNHSRYNPYVEVLTGIDSSQWLVLYQRYYPLMQKAYAELGYPRKAFHDRVLLATERLLNSPVMARPMALEQPSVMYTYADPQLQKLSAVDKQMLRLGAANARKLKALLTVLRANLVALKL